MRVTQRSVVYFQQYSKITLVLGLSLMCSFLSTMAHAASAGFFAKGSKQFAIYVGSGSAFNNNYTVIGGSAAYYFADGFDVGLSAEVWSGASPGIQKISPSLQYVFYQPSVVKPYVGIFYRRTYIDNLPDLNSTGARAGVYIAAGKNMYFGVGGVYESYLDCNQTTYVSCSDSYAEFSLTFAF